MNDQKSILVVDDEDVARVTLEVLLSKEGYNVTLSKDGNDAIKKIRQRPYDIALVDLVMPGRGGMEVLNEIKKMRPKTHVIIITGFGTIDSAVEALKKGAADFISKPFKKDEIQTAIKKVLEESRFKERPTKREDAFKIYKNLIADGTPGLCISDQKAEMVMEKYGLKEESIKQLTGLEELTNDINAFLQEYDNAIISIDGFQSLITPESLKNVKKFISDLNETLSLTNAKLIVSYDSNKIDEKVLKEFLQVVSSPYTNVISEALASPFRQRIIRFLQINRGSIFSNIRRELDVKDPPKLSFHLRKLKSAGIIEQDREKRYSLTQRGEKTYALISNLDAEGIEDMKNIVWIKSA